MSNVQKVRDALAGGGLEFEQLQAKTGLPEEFLRNTVYALTHAGEVSVTGTGPKRVVSLKPRAAEKKSAGRTKAKRAAKANGTRSKSKRFRDIAEKIAQQPAANDRSRERAHVATTLAALESVIDLDDAEEHVACIFRAHKEAVELLAA